MASLINVSVSTKEPTSSNSIAAATSRMQRKSLQESLLLIQEAAQAAISFNSKTRRLMRSIRVNVVNDHDGEVYLDESIAPYASFVHDGTGIYGDRHKPFAIMPKKGARIAWQGKNGKMFASKVMNPGQQGNPFLYDSAEKTIEDIENIYSKAIDNLLREV